MIDVNIVSAMIASAPRGLTVRSAFAAIAAGSRAHTPKSLLSKK